MTIGIILFGLLILSFIFYTGVEAIRKSEY